MVEIFPAHPIASNRHWPHQGRWKQWRHCSAPCPISAWTYTHSLATTPSASRLQRCQSSKMTTRWQPDERVSPVGLSRARVHLL